MSDDLVEFELQLLQAMAGIRPHFEWGAAVGTALECLEGRGYVKLVGGNYLLTEAGEEKARAAESLHGPRG